MANAETCRMAAGLPSRELNQGGTSTSALQFKTTNNSGPLICYIPGSGVLNFKPFRISATGLCIAGTGTPNFTASFYLGTSATVSSNTIFATTGAVAIATTQGSWMLTTDVIWDNTSQRLIGLTKGFVHATAVAQVINTAIVTAVDLSTAATSEGQGITMAGTFSAGNAANAAYVYTLEITSL